MDDEDSIQTLLTYPLERDGYTVVQARDGEEALRRFGEDSFDLFLRQLRIGPIGRDVDAEQAAVGEGHRHGRNAVCQALLLAQFLKQAR